MNKKTIKKQKFPPDSSPHQSVSSSADLSAVDIMDAVRFFQSGQLSQACDLCMQILSNDAQNPKALNLAGVIACVRGQRVAGIEYLERAVVVDPLYAAAHSNLANAYREEHRLDDAVTSYKRAIEIKPDMAGAYNNLGLVCKELGKFNDAEANLRKVIELNPADADGYNNLGVVLRSGGNKEDAIECYRRALSLKHDFPEAHLNLGNALVDRNVAEAAVNYQNALEFKPDYAEACFGLGNCYRLMGLLTEADVFYRKTLELNPDYAAAYHGLGNLLMTSGRLTEGEKCYRQSLLLEPLNANVHSSLLMCLNYSPEITEEELYAEHLSWNDIHGVTMDKIKTLFSNDPTLERTLRIGYVSADFRMHPVGFFLAPVLQEHDRSSFRVICYSQGLREDDLTLRLRKAADDWREIADLSDAELAGLIEKDGIDILVDLSGHTDGSRLTMFSLKPAPVQMTWAGYVGTTGLSAMDFLISDHRESPDGAESFCKEAIVRLPDGYVCVEPPDNAPPVGPLPLAQNGFVTFGCFNNLAKITPQVISVWAKLLRNLPESRLVLKTYALDNSKTRSYYEELFSAACIDTNRIDLLGGSSHSELLDCYNRLDIALDPFPYSGGLTTFEALWMGVPVITMGGARFCSRHSVSHLTTAGIPELIAADADRYLQLAIELAEDGERLLSLRSSLRDRVAASPLCDGKTFTRNLEREYRNAWRRWCAG